MSPVTVAGTLTQVLAEVLAGASFTQLVRPGRAGDLRHLRLVASRCSRARRPSARRSRRWSSYGAAQLARRLGLPFRTGGSLCASKVPDAQAAYESANTLNSTLLAGTNFVLHAAGWLEGGLAVLLREVHDGLRPARHACRCWPKGVDLSENGQAMDAIREVGAGQPLSRLRPHAGQFRDRLLSLLDRRQQFLRAVGGRRRARRARSAPTRPGRSALAEYEAPPIDPGIDEALRDFIEKKKASMPDATH